MKRVKYLAVILAMLCILPCCMAAKAQGFKSDAVNVSSSAAGGAECMVTIETGTNRVLYSYNMHKKRPMASVTKILTAITVIENCADLTTKAKIPAAAVGIEGSSIYLEAGESISRLDLLYGLMLRSGNDCAVALAILTSGSVEKFAALMNETAKKAGAKDSNFVNPHGLHHDNHYTTAYDLALITSYAMKNPVFKEIAATKLRKIERTKENGMTLLQNKNKLLNSFSGADGVKTGFTKKAGRCLVSSATRDGMQVVTVVLNCGPMFETCASLMNEAFKEYTLTPIGRAGEPLYDISVTNGKTKTVSAGLATDLYYPLKAGEKVAVDAKFPDEVRAPIRKGREIGKICYSLNNRLLFERELVTIEDAPALTLKDYLNVILKDW